MNFATVTQANGQNIEMFGTITRFQSEGLSKTGKAWKKVTIVDDNKESHTVTIRGENLPPVSVINQRQAFTLGTYQGNYGTGYSGFWNQNKQVRQNVPGAPGMPSEPQSQGRPTQTTPESILRISAAECAARVVNVIENPQESVQKILDIAIPLVEWFKTGDLPTGQVDEPDLPPEQQQPPFDPDNPDNY